jgi:carnitine O-acetyltransferase
VIFDSKCQHIEAHRHFSFHSSRYPTKPADTAQKFSLKENNHIVLIRKNKFFAVPLARPDGTELTAAELEV